MFKGRELLGLHMWDQEEEYSFSYFPCHGYTSLGHAGKQKVIPPKPAKPCFAGLVCATLRRPLPATSPSAQPSSHLAMRRRDDNCCGAHELVIGFDCLWSFDPNFHFEEVSVSPYIWSGAGGHPPPPRVPSPPCGCGVCPHPPCGMVVVLTLAVLLTHNTF